MFSFCVNKSLSQVGREVRKRRILKQALSTIYANFGTRVCVNLTFIPKFFFGKDAYQGSLENKIIFTDDETLIRIFCFVGLFTFCS